MKFCFLPIFSPKISFETPCSPPQADYGECARCSIFKISQKENPFNIADLRFELSASDSAFEITNPQSAILTRIFHELLSRDHETGNPLAGLSGAQRARIRWACHLATAGCWFRGVPERYVAGTDTQGRQEGRPYPWSQQVIHEVSGLQGRNHGRGCSGGGSSTFDC